MDITTLDVDAIVSSADPTMMGGRGLDGAVHEAAGEELLAYCRLLGACRPGQALLSPGFNLKARNIIHTVGPVWEGGQNGEAELLASCYRKALNIAAEKKFQSIAFPAISTGHNRYPLDAATRIAMHTVQDFLNNSDHVLREMLFACHSPREQLIYERIHDDVFSY